MKRIIAGPTIQGTAATADRSLTFAENLIPVHGSSVRRLVVSMSGTGMNLGNVTRLTLKAASQPVIDCKPTHLRALLGYFGKRSYFDSSRTDFVLPLDLFGGAAPPQALLRLEIEKNSTPGASTATLVEVVDDAPVTGYFRAIGATQPLAAGDSNRLLNVSGSGILIGVVVPDVFDVSLLRIRQGGDVVAEYPNGALIQAVYAYDRPYDPAAGEPCYVPVDPLPIVPGSTQIEASAGAGYSAEDWTIVSLS